MKFERTIEGFLGWHTNMSDLLATVCAEAEGERGKFMENSKRLLRDEIISVKKSKA